MTSSSRVLNPLEWLANLSFMFSFLFICCNRNYIVSKKRTKNISSFSESIHWRSWSRIPHSFCTMKPLRWVYGRYTANTVSLRIFPNSVNVVYFTREHGYRTYALFILLHYCCSLTCSLCKSFFFLKLIRVFLPCLSNFHSCFISAYKARNRSH